MNIPPAALEAGARAICETHCGPCRCYPDECGCAYFKAHARACFIAMIEPWEGAKTVRDDGRRQTYVLPAPILPLTEQTDDKA